MHAHRIAAELIERTAALAALHVPAELTAARAGMRRLRVRRLRAFGRARVRAALLEGLPPRAATRRARAELRTRARARDGFDEVCLAAVDVVDRHLMRAQAADGRYGFDRRRLRDVLALEALRAVEAETGLHHRSNELPAIAVRALLRECGFEPSGGDFTELLDRLADRTGRLAAAHCAQELALVLPGLAPALADALVRSSLRELGLPARRDAGCLAR